MIESVHHTLATMGTIYTLVLGVWGLALFLMRRVPGGNYNGALIIAQGIFVVQAIIGVILVVQGKQPGQGIHFLYGVCTFLTIPLAYTLTRGRADNRAALIYGIALMFLWGLTQRAFETAALH